jgi:3-carboxy-cis,cis-muconate cycloisomerase
MSSASLVDQNAGTLISGMRQHNERSGEGLLEADAVPGVFVHAEKCLEKLLIVVRGLQVFPERMRENLARTNGIILAERYMMILAAHLGRLRAHDLVHQACPQAVECNESLCDVLCRFPQVTRHLDRNTIVQLGDPMTYLGNALEMIDVVLAALPSELTPFESAQNG